MPLAGDVGVVVDVSVQLTVVDYRHYVEIPFGVVGNVQAYYDFEISVVLVAAELVVLGIGCLKNNISLYGYRIVILLKQLTFG